MTSLLLKKYSLKVIKQYKKTLGSSIYLKTSIVLYNYGGVGVQKRNKNYLIFDLSGTKEEEFFTRCSNTGVVKVLNFSLY